jgi:hypothetical protein
MMQGVDGGDDALMVEELRKAWPALPGGLEYVVQKAWQEAMASLPDDGERSPINDFTIPLAVMAREAGFQHDLQWREFIQAAMNAAAVPTDEQKTVRTVFWVQLHMSEAVPPSSGA